MQKNKIILVIVIAAVIAAFFMLDLGQYLNFETLKARQTQLASIVNSHLVLSMALFFVIYVMVTALSLPGAAIMTLAGGALFGLIGGTVLASFASSIGATLAFLMARFLLRDWVQQRYKRRLKTINNGIEKDGAFYLFSLRLVPIFPFFVINLVMGLTPMRVKTFYGVSQLGMLAGTIVYIYAGTRIAAIDGPSDILSPGLLAAFVLLGLFPLAARKFIERVQAKRVLSGYKKPRRFDRNIVVIGAGSGGLVAAYIAAAVRAKVTLIEKHRMGGDCLNYGCVPSKTLIRSSRVAELMRRSAEFGIYSDNIRVNFAEVMERVQTVITKIAPNDSVERYTSLGVETLEGEAKITSPWHVQIGDREISTRHIIIASGASPILPNIPGLDSIDYLTSNNIWDLRKLPKRLLVLGGGPIGCELSQAFACFGSEVTQVEMADRLLAREDAEISQLIEKELITSGVDVRTNYKACEIKSRQGEYILICEYGKERVEIAFDKILIAVGRTPNLKGLGLEALGISTTPGHTLPTNAFLQTRLPSILACGDVVGPQQFTHVASHQAWYATVNALFGHLKRFKVDYSVIPAVTFTAPEVARVGLNIGQAKAEGIDFEVSRYDFSQLDRAITEGQTTGFIQVLTLPRKDKILGATIVGEHAGELIGEFVTAMRHGLGLNKILATIHAYPTRIEANKFSAGVWKNAHKPQRVLNILERYHRWRRHNTKEDKAN